MKRVHHAGRRLIAVLLALSIVAMGVPWTVIHAHASIDEGRRDDSAVSHDLVLSAHLDRHHTVDPESNEDHAHDGGLFSHYPGVSGSVAVDLHYGPTAASYLEPSSLSAYGHYSPLLRPPARA